MTGFARLVISVLAALVVGTSSGCTTEVAGSPRQEDGAVRLAVPNHIQIRLVIEDVTGMADRLPDAPEGSVIAGDRSGRLFLLGPVELDGAQIQTVTARPNPTESGTWEVDITMTATGKAAFAELTQVNTGQRFAIVVQGTVVSAPRITSVLDQGKVRITGSFTEREATALAKAMNGG